MKNKRKKSLYISSVLSLALLSIVPISSANAAVYRDSFHRGARYISYVQTNFVWTTNWRNEINSSTATQWEEGICTDAAGVTRIYANGLEHIWNVKSRVSVGVWKLKYTKTFSDDISLRNNGNAKIV
ncbi:MAG TPA: hypothetical protein RWO09_03815 [Ruminococcus sp.]